MELNFSKSLEGLIPAIIQDATTKTVLMLGYMNAAALEKTQTTGQVTFYSRSKQRLWTKGEESGNFLQVIEIKVDCDQDTLLIQASPKGPICHKGTDTCWAEDNQAQFDLYINELILSSHLHFLATTWIEHQSSHLCDSFLYIQSSWINY